MESTTEIITGNGITVKVTVPIDLLLGKEVDFGNGAIVLPENKKEAIDYVEFVKADKFPINSFDISGIEYHRVNNINGSLKQMIGMVRLPKDKVTLFEKENTQFGAGIIKLLTPNQ